ncbi:hypothetical protein NE237_021772 [Protea cynaroides]|uniref:Uncharacterized protein n=1 Tax=Protea cynaroides TaxID=273540 RepID=A0A9Q0K3V3_9MAGN|nr:hypothetical protein NE237_021772 [Protea cynaroides]
MEICEGATCYGDFHSEFTVTEEEEDRGDVGGEEGENDGGACLFSRSEASEDEDSGAHDSTQAESEEIPPLIAPALKGFLCEKTVLAAPTTSATINRSATSFSGNYHGQRKSEEPLAPPPSLSLGSSSGSMPTPFLGFSPSSIDDGAALLNSQRLPLWDPPSVRRRNGGTIFGFKV